MKLQIILLAITFIAINSCNNNHTTEVQLSDGTKIKVETDITVNPKSDEYLKNLCFKKVIEDSSQLFPKFYWSLLNDTNNLLFFQKLF